MKKLNLLLLACMTVFVFSSCVTKSKYVELESRYKTCTKDLENMTSEKIDFDNKSRELLVKVVNCDEEYRFDRGLGCCQRRSPS